MGVATGDRSLDSNYQGYHMDTKRPIFCMYGLFSHFLVSVTCTCHHVYF